MPGTRHDVMVRMAVTCRYSGDDKDTCQEYLVKWYRMQDENLISSSEGEVLKDVSRIVDWVYGQAFEHRPGYSGRITRADMQLVLQQKRRSEQKVQQYGALGVQLLSGAKSADALYAALTRLENLNGLQVDLENADALTQAAKAIDPAQSGYDPLSALASYDLLEARYAELMELQRGSAEYIQRARELTDEETAAVYRQAAAYGVVTDLQAKSAQAAAASQTERTFRHADENAYAGGANYLAQAAREAEAAGEDVAQAWNRALSNLDEAGVLEGMSALFGDISMLAVECGGNVEEIIRRLYEMRDVAQSISLSDMAEELRKEREGNTAGTEGYRSQVDELFSAFGEGGMEGVFRAMEVWNSFDESLRESIAETYAEYLRASERSDFVTINTCLSINNSRHLDHMMNELNAARAAISEAVSERDEALRKSAVLEKELADGKRGQPISSTEEYEQLLEACLHELDLLRTDIHSLISMLYSFKRPIDKDMIHDPLLSDLCDAIVYRLRQFE